MDAIILFSHGSLLCGSGEALKAHVERMKKKYFTGIVEAGYLNYTKPYFAETVQKVVGMGAARIFVIPYFLVPGKFVNKDLPQAVAHIQSFFPQIEFIVAEPIGYDILLVDALLENAASAVEQDQWRFDLQKANQFCLANPECPLYGSPSCPQTYEYTEEARRE